MSLPISQRTTLEKLSDFVLRTEPLWPVPLYFLLVYDSPYFWLGWIIVLVPWPLRLWRKGYLLPRTLFDIPILIFVIGLVLGVIYSDHRLLSADAFQSYICVILFYYALADGHWIRDWKLWGAFWVLLILFIGIFILSQQASFDTSSITSFNSWFIQILPSLPNIFDSKYIPNINSLAMILNIAIPVLFSISVVGTKTHPRLRICASIFTLLFVLLTAMTNSRGGWIATGIALLVILVWRSKRALLIFPAIAGVIIWILQSGYDPLNIFQLTSESNLHRIQIWETSIQILNNYPLLGCGLGTFPIVLASYANLSFEVSSPHNQYIMLYADTGILGILAGVIAFTVIIITLHKLWQAPKNQTAHVIGIGILVSLVAIGIHGIFETSGAIIWQDSISNYRYLASILPWVAAGNLAAVMHKLKTANNL
ncbi:O-antigen ligase family protein [Chloroflexota bacterium]